jgi:hypothetical protein
MDTNKDWSTSMIHGVIEATQRFSACHVLTLSAMEYSGRPKTGGQRMIPCVCNL